MFFSTDVYEQILTALLGLIIAVGTYSITRHKRLGYWGCIGVFYLFFGRGMAYFIFKSFDQEGPAAIFNSFDLRCMALIIPIMIMVAELVTLEVRARRKIDFIKKVLPLNE